MNWGEYALGLMTILLPIITAVVADGIRTRTRIEIMAVKIHAVQERTDYLERRVNEHETRPHRS